MGGADECALRADLIVQMLAATGETERSKQYRSAELLATVDDGGVKGIAVRVKGKGETVVVVAEGRKLLGAAIAGAFVQQGKSTIKLPAARSMVLISNVHPQALRTWLGQLGPFLGLTEQPARAPSAGALALQTAARANVRAREASDETGAMTVDKRARTGSPVLNAEQQHVVSRVLAGESLFFTGAAGTGKSLVLRALIDALPSDTTAVTAMTASAASLIGGITLHAFAGFGSGERPLADLVELAARKRRDGWRRTRLLVVDEVSMLSAELLDKLEYVARALRGNEKPFGGMQLVFCGDFFQLPPVSRRGSAAARFAFQAAAWRRCALEAVELAQVYRQAEPELVRMLNEVRVGQLSASALATLARCERALDSAAASGVRPTRLFTHRSDCDAINEAELGALETAAVTLRAIDSGAGLHGLTLAQLLDGCAAKPALVLREGAQVLLLKSIAPAAGLVNGARGVVVRFERAAPVVRFACGVERRLEPQPFIVVVDGRTVACRSQVPLALGWAISVHRAQGLSLDRLEVSLSKAFEYGQAYVALSRCRSLEGLCVRDFDPSAVRAHPDVLDFHERLRAVAAAAGGREAGRHRPAFDE